MQLFKPAGEGVGAGRWEAEVEAGHPEEVVEEG